MTNLQDKDGERDDGVEEWRERRDPREAFDLWWPVIARVVGVGFAIIHVLLAQIGVGDIDPAVLTFCGSLTLVSALGGSTKR